MQNLNTNFTNLVLASSIMYNIFRKINNYFINLINLNSYFKILFIKFSLDTYPIDEWYKILHSN